MKRMTAETAIRVLVASLVCGAPALAHHSYSMFAMNTRVEVQGTVKKFNWTNPHAWLVLTTKDAAGNVVDAHIEMNGPGYMARNGWKRETLKMGDVVTATIHPLRDGSPGGDLVKIALPDGRVLSAEIQIASPPGTKQPPAAPAAGEKR
jgi:hypothetical protein